MLLTRCGAGAVARLRGSELNFLQQKKKFLGAAWRGGRASGARSGETWRRGRRVSKSRARSKTPRPSKLRQAAASCTGKHAPETPLRSLRSPFCPNVWCCWHPNYRPGPAPHLLSSRPVFLLFCRHRAACRISSVSSAACCTIQRPVYATCRQWLGARQSRIGLCGSVGKARQSFAKPALPALTTINSFPTTSFFSALA